MKQYELGKVATRVNGRLPHWDADHAIYFLTWNLFDAFPARQLHELRERTRREEESIKRLRGRLTIAESHASVARHLRRIQRQLDESSGSCVLKDQRCATIVANAIQFFDGRRYHLLGWCVMPNHVHVVVQPTAGFSYSSLLHSWKGFTSKEINKLLERTGTLWQEDAFDRCLRNPRHLERTIAYVANNPSKAGLLNWPFVRTYPDRIAAAL